MESNTNQLKTVFVSSILAGTLCMASLIPVPVEIAEAEPKSKGTEQTDVELLAISAELKDKMVPTYMKEGYSNYQEYKEDLDRLKEKSKGKATNIINTYKNIAEEQKEKLIALEQKVSNAGLISSLNSYLEEIDCIAEEIKTKTSVYSNSNSNYSIPSANGILTKSGGVNYYGGNRETWYSQRVLPGGGLNIPGRHVREDGVVVDGDGYVVVATGNGPTGELVDTSLGMGKSYDYCPSGANDIYVDW